MGCKGSRDPPLDECEAAGKEFVANKTVEPSRFARARLTSCQAQIFSYHTSYNEVSRFPVTKNPSLMSGVPELLVLRILSAQEMYGYELARAIRETTREAISLGEGVLYPALHAMESRGFLKTRRRTIAGRTRVYYTITPKGRRRLNELSQEWRRIAAGVKSVLAGT
jgi:PadR family transcriptional regulator PadR